MHVSYCSVYVKRDRCSFENVECVHFTGETGMRAKKAFVIFNSGILEIID